MGPPVTAKREGFRLSTHKQVKEVCLQLTTMASGGDPMWSFPFWYSSCDMTSVCDMKATDLSLSASNGWLWYHPIHECSGLICPRHMPRIRVTVSVNLTRSQAKPSQACGGKHCKKWDSQRLTLPRLSAINACATFTSSLSATTKVSLPSAASGMACPHTPIHNRVTTNDTTSEPTSTTTTTM